VRCSIDSFTFHARRAGHEVHASGEASGTITKPTPEERYQFVEIKLRIEAQLTPRAENTDALVELAERDCFVGASLKVKPEYEWHVS
jgi:organic hydroperoxide reductase OsmC/OhrA